MSASRDIPTPAAVRSDADEQVRSAQQGPDWREQAQASMADLRTEIARLTGRIERLRAAQLQQLATEHQDQAEADRAGQLTRWHADDQATEDGGRGREATAC